MIDVKLDVIGVSLGSPSDEDLENGVDPRLEVNLSVGLPLPLADPRTQQPIIAPVMNVTYSLTPKAAKEFGEGLLQEAERMPQTSSGAIQVASSLNGIEDAVKELERFKA